jgi:ABC-2 type transport system permease protein
MRWLRLVRSELRKLTTTKMPWAFVLVLLAISTITAIAVVYGTDADGSKAFIATRADQRSLLAFAGNAMLGASLFGAIAVAREYGHGTVVPMFLGAPHRHHAALAQLAAVFTVGGILGALGGAFTVLAGVISIAIIERDWLLPAGDIARIVLASGFAGAMGATLGAGIGALVRNTGGAVTAAVLLLIIIPPVAVQLSTHAASWVPNTLAASISGVGAEPAALAALLALAVWGLVPAVVGVVAVRARDVV